MESHKTASDVTPAIVEAWARTFVFVCRHILAMLFVLQECKYDSSSKQVQFYFNPWCFFPLTNHYFFALSAFLINKLLSLVKPDIFDLVFIKNIYLFSWVRS